MNKSVKVMGWLGIWFNAKAVYGLLRAINNITFAGILFLVAN